MTKACVPEVDNLQKIVEGAFKDTYAWTVASHWWGALPPPLCDLSAYRDGENAYLQQHMLCTVHFNLSARKF